MKSFERKANKEGDQIVSGSSRNKEDIGDVLRSKRSFQRMDSATVRVQGRNEERVLDTWVDQSTVKRMGIEKPRSQQLRQVDDAVTNLARTYQQGDERAVLHAALSVREQLENWESTKSSEHVSKRDHAVTELRNTTQRIVDTFYSKLAQKMKSVPSSEGLSGRSWVHGTDAMAEILATGDVYGGTAALKLLGTDKNQREVVGASREAEGSTRIERGQEQHFYMALTESDGTTEKPGNAYIKGRQAADSKLRRGPLEHLPSWKHGLRPLMGVLEMQASTEDADLEDAQKNSGYSNRYNESRKSFNAPITRFKAQRDAYD